MKNLAMVVVAAVLAITAAPRAAEQTWSGKISDSACGAKHEEAAEGQGVMADRECTQACVRGGSKYVLVVSEERDGFSRAKVFQIANQDKITPEAYGQVVTLTGKTEGDTITVESLKL